MFSFVVNLARVGLAKNNSSSDQFYPFNRNLKEVEEEMVTKKKYVDPKAGKLRVSLSGLDPNDKTKVTELLRDFGGPKVDLVDTQVQQLPPDTTHLITSNSTFGKTEKLQSALARGNVVIIEVLHLVSK